MSELLWSADNDTPYPLTSDGEISCGIHPNFGPVIYFKSVSFADEFSTDNLLHKAAVQSLKQTVLTPNVPYGVSDDLSDIRVMKLKVYDR